MEHIVILGGGFAGINLAKQLAKKANYNITLVDKNNYHFFPPLLYQVGTAFIEASNISYPFRKLFQGMDVHYFMGELIAIDTQQQTVETTNGILKYDKLVLAMGSETNFFNNADIEKFALPMKSIDDAIELRNHILLQLEEAVRIPSDAERTRYSNIVIAGGGPTGVELAGMLAEMGRKIVPKDYPAVHNWSGKIYLIDGLNMLLAPMSSKSQREAYSVLEKLGVNIILGKLVEGYEGKTVRLSDGSTIESATLIWASGVMGRLAPGLPEKSIGKGRRILVDEYNKVLNVDNIYAIGDQCLQLSDTAYPNGHPQLAQVAIQQGRLLANNLILTHKNKKWKRFTYNDKGSMAIIAKFRAVVDLPKGFFSGFFAWMVWLFIHIIPIAGFRNKVKLAFSWLWSFITNDPTLRLIIRPNNESKRVKNDRQ